MSDATNGTTEKQALVKRQEASKAEIAAYRPTGDKALDFLNTLESQTRVATAIAKTGFTPFKKAEEVLAVMLMGSELGLPGPMAASRTIYPVPAPGGGQRLGLYADLMVGLAIQRAGVTLQVLESTTEKARIRFAREGWEPHEEEYTIEDAKTAGLAGKPNWKQNPKKMLLARAKAGGVRVIAPDILAGLYSVEELRDGVVPEVEAPEVDATKTRTEAVAELLDDEDEETDFEVVGSEPSLEGDGEPATEEPPSDPAAEPDDIDYWRKKYFATVAELRPGWVKKPADRKDVQKLHVKKASTKDFTVDDYRTMIAHISPKEAVPA